MPEQSKAWTWITSFHSPTARQDIPTRQPRKLVPGRRKGPCLGQTARDRAAACALSGSTATTLYAIKGRVFTNLYRVYDLLPSLGAKDLPMSLRGCGYTGKERSRLGSLGMLGSRSAFNCISKNTVRFEGHRGNAIRHCEKRGFW